MARNMVDLRTSMYEKSCLIPIGFAMFRPLGDLERDCNAGTPGHETHFFSHHLVNDVWDKWWYN